MLNPMSQRPEPHTYIALVTQDGQEIYLCYYGNPLGGAGYVIGIGSDKQDNWELLQHHAGWRPIVKPPVRVKLVERGINDYICSCGIYYLEVWSDPMRGWQWRIGLKVSRRKPRAICGGTKVESFKEAQAAAVAWYNENIAEKARLTQ